MSVRKVFKKFDNLIKTRMNFLEKSNKMNTVNTILEENKNS